MSKCDVGSMTNFSFLSLSFRLYPQKGDIIDVFSMNASGIWRGGKGGRVGYFQSMNFEVIPDQEGKTIKKMDRGSRRACPSTVDELLSRIGLKEYTSVFVLNG
jgi:Variant SH3 domain